MLSLGGAIGAGLFAGSSSAIQAAGPSVMLAYLLAGLILFVVIYGVGQIVLQQKNKICRNVRNRFSILRESLGTFYRLGVLG